MTKNSIEEAFHSAIRSGKDEIAIKLIAEGADVNYLDKFGNDALFYSVVYCRSKIVKYLLDKGASLASLYEDSQNILHVAVRTECEDKGCFDIIESLVNHAVEINAQDIYGNTPVWYACIYYVINKRTIDLLLSSGADMNIVNKYGLSCYTSAQENDRKELLDYLNKFRN